MSKNHAVSHAYLKDNTFLEIQDVNAFCQMCGAWYTIGFSLGKIPVTY